MKNGEYEALIGRCGLFDGAPVDRGWYERLFTEEHYLRGERVLFSRGGGALGVLARGKMRVGGRRAAHRTVINEMTPGAVFGYASLGARGSRFDSDIWAKTAATVLWLPQERLEELIAEYPRVALNVISAQAAKIRFLNERIREVSAPESREKLLLYLKTLPRQSDGRVLLPCGMSGLAGRLGIGRASLYRVFDQCVGEGLIVRLDDGSLLLTGTPDEQPGKAPDEQPDEQR